MASIANVTVNTQLLGMKKVVSDDSARRALQKIDEHKGSDWLQNHLHSCYEPLLTTPWILDVDVTIKPLYGRQEGAVKGYNPHKPGRPCQTYHTYIPKLPQDAYFRAITALAEQGTLAKECNYLSNQCNAVLEAL